MIPTIITIQNKKKFSFDILQHREKLFSAEDGHYLFEFATQEEAIEAAENITLSYSYKTKIIKLDGNEQEVLHIHFDSRNLAQGLFVDDLKKMPPAYARHQLGGTFKACNNYDACLAAMTENLKPFLTHLQEKLIKPQAPKGNYGMVGRSEDWGGYYFTTDEKSRGYGFIPKPSLPNSIWQKGLAGINAFDTKNPNFINTVQGLQSPGGSFYHCVFDMGDIHILVKSNPDKNAHPVLEKIVNQSKELRKRKRKGYTFFDKENTSSNKMLKKNEKQKNISSIKIMKTSRKEKKHGNQSSHLQPVMESIKDKIVNFEEKISDKIFFLKRKIKVTEKKLANVAQAKEKNGRRRICGQTDFFDYTPADRAAELLGLPLIDKQGKKIKYEWTHLIAHEFYGDKAQQKDNLVLATAACNTLMMHLEFVLKKYALNNHKVDIEVQAAIPGSGDRNKFHYTDRTLYNVVIDNLHTFSFEFDPLSPIIPPKETFKAIEGFIDSQLRDNLYSEKVAKLLKFDDIEPINVPSI